MRKTFLFTALVCLLSFAAPAMAGYVLHTKEDSQGTAGVTYVENNRMTVEMPQITTIMDLNNQTACLIAVPSKSYWQGPINKMGEEAMAGVQKQMDQMLAQMPPEQRKMMKEMMKKQGMPMKGGPKAKVTIKKTGQSATIAGYKAEEYQIYADGRLSAALWISPKLTMRDELDPAKLEKALADMGKVSQGLGAMSSPEVAKLWAKGYPLKQVFYAMGQNGGVTVTKVEKKSVPGSKFQPPAGYRKASMAELMGGMGGRK